MSEKPDLGFSQYPTQKKSKVNKWIKIGVPVLILVVIVAVLAGVFGTRAAKKQDSTLAANSDAAASSEANAQSSIRQELGRFATATDEYFLPVYPSTVSAHLHAPFTRHGPLLAKATGPAQDTFCLRAWLFTYIFLRPTPLLLAIRPSFLLKMPPSSGLPTISSRQTHPSTTSALAAPGFLLPSTSGMLFRTSSSRIPI